MIQADKIPTVKQFYLSKQEIGCHARPTKFKMDNDITFEERISISSIQLKHDDFTGSILPPLSNFSPQFQTMIKEFSLSIAFNKPIDLSSFNDLSLKEQDLACMLSFTAKQIKKKAKLLTCSLSKKFKNNEFNFTIKYVSLLFESVVCSSSLSLDWDVTANCYINCDIEVHFNRHDMIITTEDGTEIGTGEIKPFNTTDQLVEVDRSRVAESCKRQLHQRLLNARSEKELKTYGILINGKQIQLSILSLSSEGEYNYHIVYDNFFTYYKRNICIHERNLDDVNSICTIHGGFIAWS